MEFYNVKTRSKVDVPESQVQKKRFERETSKGKQVRYAAVATVDGTKLTKFINAEMFNSLKVNEVK